MTQPISPWTEEITAEVLSMFEAGATTTTISLRFAERGIKLTRNMIIGKLHRMGRRSAETPHIAKPERPARVSERNVRAKAPPSPRPFIPRIVELEPLHITLLDLADETCRYECSKQDDPALFAFCGHPANQGQPYCGHHAALCFLPPRPRMVFA
jgi:GcrA cell cycle regulator